MAGPHAGCLAEVRTYVEEKKYKLARFSDTRPVSASKLIAELAKKESEGKDAEEGLNADDVEEDKSADESERGRTLTIVKYPPL